MKHNPTTRFKFRPTPAALIFGAFAVLGFGTALADPPDRVARLSYESGTVTFEPAGTQDWVNATLNRPLMTGDALWVDNASRAELNVGRAALRADTQTSISLTNLDDRLAQFQLAQGTVILTVRSIAPDGMYEIDTPNLAVTINQPGVYRVTVTPDGQSTYVLVRRGAATANGDNQSYAIGAGQSYSFTGNDLSNYTYYDPPAPDDFDRFSASRDARWERSPSLRYVSPEMIGYEDLDANGTWQPSEEYGNVWVPNNVPADWAPYHDGHWAWVAPWGWTWVDDAPWGFAPFHYGRWALIGPRWAWIPGPIAVAPVYSPALVAFVGGPGFSVGVGGVGVAWFPLGPREVYRPGYEVSAAYVQRVNVSNTTINTTVITNVYNNPGSAHYAYQSVPGAVVAVPSAAFAGGQSVTRAAIHLAPSAIASAQVSVVAPIAPTQRAVTGPGAPSPVRPSPAVLARPVIARTLPPPAPVSFAAKQEALTTNPGHPLAPAAEAQIRQAPGAELARPQPRVIERPAPTAIAPPQRAATPGGAFGGGIPAAGNPGGANPGFARPGMPAAAPVARPAIPNAPSAPAGPFTPTAPSGVPNPPRNFGQPVDIQNQRAIDQARQAAPRPAEPVPQVQARPQAPAQPNAMPRPEQSRAEPARPGAPKPENEKEKKDER